MAGLYGTYEPLNVFLDSYRVHDINADENVELKAYLLIKEHEPLTKHDVIEWQQYVNFLKMLPPHLDVVNEALIYANERLTHTPLPAAKKPVRAKKRRALNRYISGLMSRR